MHFKRPVAGYSIEKGRVDSVAQSWLMLPLFLSPGQNTQEWARELRSDDFELLCLNGTRKPVTEAQNCHLAVAPSHAVVSRKEKAAQVEQMLLTEQVWITRASCAFFLFLFCFSF